MADETRLLVARHGNESIDEALSTLVPQFYEDPLFRWVFHTYDDLERCRRMWEILKPTIKSAPASGGFILDAKDWGAVMVVTGPGQKHDSLPVMWKSDGISATFRSGFRSTTRLLHSCLSQMDKVRAKALGSNKMYDCWYILTTATRPSKRRQGLLTAMMERIKKLARADGKPIWLESTTQYSQRQFLRMGFELAGDVRLGKGKVNANGFKEKGGEGIVISGMIWRPKES